MSPCLKATPLSSILSPEKNLKKLHELNFKHFDQPYYFYVVFYVKWKLILHEQQS